MEAIDPFPSIINGSISIHFYPFSLEIFLWSIALIVLLICSALMSGSEVAFFSLKPADLNQLKKKNSKSAHRIRELLEKPEQLLGTILVSNNLVNIAIVIMAAYISNSLIDFSQAPVLGFLVQIVLIAFILLLFGEILPKVYANQFQAKFVAFTAFPLFILEKLFKPVVFLLTGSTSLVQKRIISHKANLSMDDISDALELPATKIEEDEQILKGIAKFGNIEAGEIMKSRIDIFAVNLATPFPQLLKDILDSGYSRIPIYAKSIDNIKGILYIKDLLPHLQKKATFKWQSLIRPPYFIPESKKINDLLEEFQAKKIHMAIVIDEYGGTNGIVTLEDILEEIVGEITDEFDDEEQFYKKVGENIYIFEGKTLLNDFYKVVNQPADLFDDIKGEADTIAGLILEIKGAIPAKGDIFELGGFDFEISAVDNRRIKKVKVSPHKKTVDDKK